MLLDTFLLILIKVGQRHTVLAVGAGGGGLDISFLFSFFLCVGDGKIKSDILSQKTVKIKNNQSVS